MDEFDEKEVEVRVLTTSRDLDDYDILSIMPISAAVPHQTTESFRKYIWAAMVTYAFGNKSIDHVMSKYDYMWQHFKESAFERNPQILILRELVELIDEIASDLESFEVESSTSKICSKAALCRLEASFKAAYGLIRKEYIFESDAVIRIIIEQLAWSYVCSTTDDKKIPSLQPNKCITHFKSVFPDCGKVYGHLSKWAHIDPFVVAEYMKFHKEDIPVVRRALHNSLQSGNCLVILGGVYVQLVQKMFTIYKDEKYTEYIGKFFDFRKRYEREFSESKG